MISLTRLTRWALRAAAQRWPADLREELHREWQAELAHLEARPGTAGKRLRFAFSLLASPPVRDAAGVPRGWAEARPAMSPAGVLMLAALFGIGVTGLAQQVWYPYVTSFGERAFGLLSPRGHSIIDGLVLALWCVPVAWWLGRRRPMARDGRLGVAGPAVLAPLAVLPALFVWSSGSDGPLIPSLVTVLGVLAWTALTVVLGWAAVRGSRPLAGLLVIVGVPVAAVAAAAVATVPVLIAQGWDATVAALLMTDSLALRPDETGLLVYTGGSIGPFLAYGWLAVIYGLRAAGAPERPVRLAEPVRAPAGRTRPVVLAAGLAAVLAGVLAWAYTVTVLTPAMPVMSEAAPMPGGDGEIYLWVAELRWTSILLAAIGALVATANRRSAPRTAILLAAGLLVAESVLLANTVTGASGLRIALLAAAVVIAVSWALAGPVLGDPAGRVGWARTATAAIAAAAVGPLLYSQATPPENHPFMPLGLPLTTGVVAVGLVMLATITAVATSPHHLHPVVSALLVVVPATVLAGLGVFLGNGVSDRIAGYGTVLGLPLAVVVTALLRRHPPRRPGRTALLWTLLAIVAAPASIVLLLAAIMPLSFAAELLFQVDGTGYPADGLSVVPGAVLLLLPAAVWLAGRPGGAAGVDALPAPEPEPQPVR